MAFRTVISFTSFVSYLLIQSCVMTGEKPVIYSVAGKESPSEKEIWLTHEHLLVDFIGADSISFDRWDKEAVISVMKPYLEEIADHDVQYFVDATPAYLGRDAELLKELSEQAGVKILSNTGFYGARQNKFIPQFAFDLSSGELAEIWIGEFEDGIDNTSIKPGFIKIAVDVADPLDPMQQKLVEAAAIAHLETGLTIGSHTGKALALWPQLKILKENGVSPEAFIWIHADNEKDYSNYIKAAEEGCWISFDKFAWNLDAPLDRLIFAKENGILDKILISHDAGWYDPAKEEQNPRGFTAIFEKVIPELKANGFTGEDLDLLLKVNPVKAFGIKKRAFSEK